MTINQRICTLPVSPAVLLPFDNDLAIDEAAFRKHLRDVAATDGISAITINAHSTEVASCTFDEQRKVLDIARDEIGARLPLVNGIWADGSLEAARIARMATAGGAYKRKWDKMLRTSHGTTNSAGLRQDVCSLKEPASLQRSRARGRAKSLRDSLKHRPPSRSGGPKITRRGISSPTA